MDHAKAAEMAMIMYRSAKDTANTSKHPAQDKNDGNNNSEE